MTFSIVARCAETGMFGSSVVSSSPAVGARCIYARAGVGAVNSQNITDPTLGPYLLDLMADGLEPVAAVDRMKADKTHLDFRQVLVVSTNGRTAVYTGGEALGVFGDAYAENVACGGNLLADAAIPQIMVDAFLAASGSLAERILTAMRAAMDAGGEAGPVHSGGLMLVREVPWPVADLRIDWTDDDPVAELEDLWAKYAPQLDAYVTRALDPSAAPSYGVPGDED